MTKDQKIEKELKQLDLLERRLMLADKFLNLRDNHENSLFKNEWILKNILKLSDVEIDENK